MADITTVQIPLLANAILEKENKENKTMSKEQRCIAKWIDKDGNTINFERFSTSNIKKIENDCIELNADTLIASKDTLSNFDYFKVFETEPDGTNEKLMLTIPAHLYLEKIANFYKKKHEHFPYEDEFDAARWKNITDKRAERMGITELTIWEKLNKEAKTNYVLDKLSKAGIEVVTDKEEFDRILGQEDRLQKMAGKSPKWLTVDDVKTLSSFGYKNFDDIRQIQEAILVSSYELNDKKTTVNKVIEILGRQEFLGSIARSAFHWTSGNTKDGNYVHFDSSILFSRDEKYRQNREKLEQAYRESKEHIGILNDILTKESYFTFNKEDAKHFNEQINDWEEDNSNPQKLIIVGNIPPVMKILGISDRLIEVEHSTLDKMIRDYPLYPDDKQGHKLNIDAIRSIPSELANPVMVFKSKTRADSYVFFTERKDSENRSILIPLAVDKRKGRIIINEITSMYGKDNEIDFVKSNFDEDKLLYIDKERADKWNKEWDLKTKSSNGELVTKIQFLGQRITDIETYIPNILTKERLVNFISGRDQNEYLQKMTAGENTYGFIHNGKIYLNPEIMNSNAVVHEYTHLWDAYTQKTNPELWNKGLEVFKNTSLWNDVINDENYSDIKNNENLVLSECHARLCGKIADEVLQKVLERDGDLKKTDMINWDNETWEYIGVEFRTAAIKVLEAETKEFSFNNTKEFLEQFLSTPMKDLFQKELNMKLEKTYEQKYPSYIKNRFVLEQNHPDGWAVGKNMWVVWDNLLNQRGRSEGFFDTEKGIEVGNKELNEIIDSVNKSETEALEKEYEGNGVYTCQLFSDYSGYGSTTTRHDMLFVSAKNNKSGTGIDVAGVRDSDCGTIRSYVKDYAKRNNILSDGLIVSFNPVDKRKEANKLWTDFSMLAKETDTSFVYQDGDKESRYAFAIDYAQKHNLPCFLIDNEISRKVANDVDFVVFCKDYEDIITKVKSLSEEKTVSESIHENNNDILKHCNSIIDKYTNTHFTSIEQNYINKCENEETNRHQALMSLCNMKYLHCTTKDKDGYWEINKGKEITANEARNLLSYDDFASGVDRASFHITAGRTANDGSFIYFNDGDRKRDVLPYELTKEDIELLSHYEEAGGSKENIPEAILQELSKNYTNNHNLHNKKQANSIELTSDDLKNAKALLPKEQYQLVLSYTQGEDAEHFKGIIKEISAKTEKIKRKGEILTEDEKHPLAFKYTLGNSRFYFSEWDGNDELFGYAVLNNDTQNSEWGYTSLEELKNAGGRDSNGFPVLPEMTFYGLEETIEKQISIDYPELSEKMGFTHKKNHNEELISEFGKEILETLDNRKLEHSAYNICCAAQFVLRSMDSSEKKEVFSIMEKCGCQGKYIKENTEDFLTEVINAESKTASAVYSRNRLYERINKACSTKKIEANKGIQNPESDYDMEI